LYSPLTPQFPQKYLIKWTNPSMTFVSLSPSRPNILVSRLFVVKIVAASRVVKHTRRGAARRGNSARAQVLGIAGTPPAAKARLAITPKAASTATQPVEKIVVSNLPDDVNEAQVKVRSFFYQFVRTGLNFELSFQELFQTTVGPLREVNLHYDANGRSKGVASVIFQKKGDGNKAYQQYNNRLIDGS
jgi:THO complex subunit 4